MVCDSLAFGFSAGSIFIHFLIPYVPKIMKFNYLRLLLIAITEFVILLMFSAFICGISAVSVDKSGFANNTIYSCALFSFFVPLTFLTVYFSLTSSTWNIPQALFSLTTKWLLSNNSFATNVISLPQQQSATFFASFTCISASGWNLCSGIQFGLSAFIVVGLFL